MTFSNKIFISICRFLLMLLVSSQTLAANDKDKMYLYTRDGAIQRLDLNMVRKITFAEQSFNIHFVNANEKFRTISYDTVISFTDRNSGIQSIKTDDRKDIQFSMNYPFINIESLDLISEIHVYNLHGLQILKQKINSLSASISLDTMGKGIYIISVTTKHGIHNIKIII